VEIITKEALRELSQPEEELVEIAPGQAVRVRGFTLGQVTTIQQSCQSFDASGKMHYDAKQDRLLSFIACVVEPALSLEDTAWVESLADGVAEKVVGTAMRLSKRTQSSYDDLKDSLRRNPLLRRIYSVCVHKLGRLPSELGGVTESEFMTALAILEIEAEEAEKANPE
jgi:hypothetical protein